MSAEKPRAVTEAKAEMSARLDALIASGAISTEAPAEFQARQDARTNPIYSPYWPLSIEQMKAAKAERAARILASAQVADTQARRDTLTLDAHRIFEEFGTPKQSWLDRKIAQYIEERKEREAELVRFTKPEDAERAVIQPFPPNWRRYMAFLFMKCDNHHNLSDDELLAEVLDDETGWDYFPFNMSGSSMWNKSRLPREEWLRVKARIDGGCLKAEL